jgi:HEAT repeat protein
VAALCRALADADPLVRGHAVWAARRLGRPDLLHEVAGIAHDPDPLVRAELEADVDARVPTAAAAPKSVRPPAG